MRLKRCLPFVAEKAKDIWIDSCIRMSRTLLDYWEPDGSRRTSTSERDLTDNLEDFFEAAKCTRYDRDIQEYVEDGDDDRNDRRRDRSKNSPLSARSRTNEDDYPFFVRLPKNKVRNSTIPLIVNT